MKSYFHVCADGDDAQNFIICEADFVVAFNLVGVCAANTEADVVCFNIEDSHPHFLLLGEDEDCLEFKVMYESSYMHHIVQTRGSADDVVLDMEIYKVTDEEYLLNLGTYIVVQPTKDGKDIMPFDYRWGSGCLYFRREPYVPVWRFGKNGKIMPLRQIKDLGYDERQALLHSRKTVPGDWYICGDILLPTNYVDIGMFENIYRTCNRYRSFMTAGRKNDEPILRRLAELRGVTMADLEARRHCKETCSEMFGFKDVRRLSGTQRVSLAQRLRKEYHMSYRQLAYIVRLPESEVRKYVH